MLQSAPVPPPSAQIWLARKLDGIAILIAFSGIMNVAGALFILHVYDKVIPDHSLSALGLAFVAVVAVYILQSALRYIARRKAEHVANMFLACFEPLAHAMIRQFPASAEAEARLVAIYHTARFLRSKRLIIVLDLIWAPFFLACLFYVSAVIGLFSLAILVLLALATWALHSDSNPNAPPRRAAHRRRDMPPFNLTKQIPRNGAEATMTAMVRPASEPNESLLRAVISTLKNIAHSGILAIGAWLVITDQLEIGELMASSMLMMRLFSPARALADEWQELRRFWPLWKRLRHQEWRSAAAIHPDGGSHPILSK